MPLISSFASGSARGFGQFSVNAAPDFTISPAVSGKTSWSMTADGNLNLSSHGEWTITPLKDFTVTAKMWGGGGASGFTYTSANFATETNGMGPGGGGGYSTAVMKFLAGSSYIFRVGQGGSRSNSVTGGATYVAGGIGLTNGGSQGAGYTGIFKTSVSQANAILMAGGGGGGADSAFGAAGAGGGTSGASTTSGAQGGNGGTDTAGGAASIYNGATAGSALTGGVAQSSVQSSLGGGGGGYFGGGGGNVGGGGGGSGRVNTGFSEIVSGSSTTAGSGSTQANNTDADCGGAGAGSSTIAKGADGKILLKAI